VARTRQLIQIGGLVAKAGLLDLLEVDPMMDLQMGGPEAARISATFMGAFASLAVALATAEGNGVRHEWHGAGVVLMREEVR
jgi:hypothetical protein